MSKEKNWDPNTKKASDETRKFSKKTQQEIDKLSNKSKKTWLDGAAELLGGIEKGSSSY